MSFPISVETLGNTLVVTFHITCIPINEQVERFTYLRTVLDFSEHVLAALWNDHVVKPITHG
jgi:hypothetical protein